MTLSIFTGFQPNALFFQSHLNLFILVFAVHVLWLFIGNIGISLECKDCKIRILTSNFLVHIFTVNWTFKIFHISFSLNFGSETFSKFQLHRSRNSNFIKICRSCLLVVQAKTDDVSKLRQQAHNLQYINEQQELLSLFQFSKHENNTQY